MTGRASLIDRIDAAFVSAKASRLSYWDLARAVFPRELYPDAWRHATRGGPPGCYMALSAALRRGGFTVAFMNERGEWLYGPARIVHRRAKS